MRIEINAGGLGNGVAINGFQSDMSSFISSAETVISSFKTVKNETYNLSGGVGSLQCSLDDISARIQKEETKVSNAKTIQSQSNDFLELAARVDGQVSCLVDNNKDEFYKVNSWIKPVANAKEDKPWYEDAWNWLCGVGEAVAESVDRAWDWVKDTASKAWAGLVEFYNEHWYDIINWGVTILCAVGSIIAIALIPVTGGASILLIAGISALSAAIVAATRSMTTQYRDKGTIDPGEVIKEASIAAVVGAITGAIGAGVGGSISNGLASTRWGATLLNSSSSAVRVTTGAIIGSTSEVSSGILTRGAAEATESYLETGNVDFGDVWDAAVDPQQMALDAIIGGTSGGISAKRNPIGKEASLDAADEKILETQPNNSPNSQKRIQESGGIIYAENGNSITYPQRSKNAPDGKLYSEAVIFEGDVSFGERINGKNITHNVHMKRKVYQLGDNYKIDYNYVRSDGKTNLQAMLDGGSPIVEFVDEAGQKVTTTIELHHLTQQEVIHTPNAEFQQGTIVEMPAVVHNKYDKAIHVQYPDKNVVHRSFRQTQVFDQTGERISHDWVRSFDDRQYEAFKKEYWKTRALIDNPK